MKFTGLNYKIELTRTVTIYKETIIENMIKNTLGFYHIQDGHGSLLQDGKELHFKKGDFVFLPANKVISYHQPVGLCLSCVRFQVKLFHNINLSDLYILNQLAKLQVSKESIEAIHKLVELFYDESDEACFEKYECVNRLLKILFYQLKPTPIPNAWDAMEDFKPIFEHIENHLHEPISISTLAERVHLNPNYLSHRFKNIFGMPLSLFIQQKRIEKATGLLINDSVTITEASKACGFNDIYYFSKVFKQHTGRSPSQYRHYLNTSYQY